MADDRWGSAGSGAASGATAGSAFGPWGTAIGAVVGGVGGYLSGGGSNQQTTQYIPPSFSPQQQGLQNLLYYGAMANLYPQQTDYQGLLNQYIYGGMPGAQATQPTTGTTAEQIISGYQGQVSQAKETEKQLGELEEDIVSKTLAPYVKHLRSMDSLDVDERIGKKEETIEIAKKTSQQLADLAKMDKREADAIVMQLNNRALWTYGGTYKGKKSNKPILEAGIFAEDIGYSSTLDQNIDYFVARQWSRDSLSSQLGKQHSLGRYGTEEEISQQISEISFPAETVRAAETDIQEPSAPTTAQIPSAPSGILGQIADPSWMGEQFRLAKEEGMGEIGDWYSQAARELEQRGIAQHGGLMGSQYERDIGGLLGKRGEMQTQLGSGLRQAQIGLERQNWFDVLNALTGLQGQQAGLYAQRTNPWIGAAQNIANAPYGTSTQVTTTPGVGAFPAAISGAYTGAGLAQSLSNWGQKPATAYGAGMTNIPGTYGASPSGYEGSMSGFGY